MCKRHNDSCGFTRRDRRDWIPRSPDLTPCDVCPVGICERPRMPQSLRERISQAIANVDESYRVVVGRATNWALIEHLWISVRVILVCRSRYSAVGMTTGYGHDHGGVGVRVPVWSRIFLFSTSSRPVLGPTQSPIRWVPGALSPEVKRMGREADHWSPTSTKVKKTWIYISTPPYAFIA
jgi:hypothetical protein